jgi:hypothetical protein
MVPTPNRLRDVLPALACLPAAAVATRIGVIGIMCANGT